MTTDTLTPAVCDALAYLRSLSQDAVRPEEARARMRSLRAQHPQLRIDLLWEEEACDHSVHYDALLHRTGEGTVSLSLCPEETLPWPLRGVQRWSEMDLVRVNSTVLKVDQAVALLDFIWDEAPILKRLVDACLIQEALEREPVSLSDDDLQRALDAFRRAHGLYSARQMHDWMDRRGLTHETLERHVAELAQVTKLREQIASGRVEGYFADHRAAFDSATLAQFRVTDGEHARQIADAIRSGQLDFYTAAERFFLADSARGDSVLTNVTRGGANEDLHDAFTAPVGTVLGPLARGKDFLIVRVVATQPACLDAATRATIVQRLFEDWLDARRQKATIEWHWGPSTQPTPEVSE